MYKHKQTKEHQRMQNKASNEPIFPWYRWGPYVSERSWGTVREDYSNNGDAWRYLTYNMVPSKALRWGEDGIAGICDRFQVMALSFAFWNGHDSLLKERIFGLSPHEGNHGEDVKDYYYYLDNTPSHSYMKFLYKYPHSAFPYEKLIEENQRRNKSDREYELIDTGIFDQDKYFDIYIEFAKQDPEDIVIKVEVFNRADEDAKLYLLPQLVFRKSFQKPSKGHEDPCISSKSHDEVNCLECDDTKADPIEIVPFEYKLGKRYFYGDQKSKPLFTNNESNHKILEGKENNSKYVKDAFHRYIIEGDKEAINPEQVGTKATLCYEEVIPKKDSKTYYFRFVNKELKDPLKDAEKIIQTRRAEADEFYDSIHPKQLSEDEKNIQRQALAGMLWSKQFYYFEVAKWLKGDDVNNPLPERREMLRNRHWKHLVSMRILSMPDKWEYPWFAAWDLAFHTITLALVDIDFAKEQLWLLLFDQFQHPNGQIPAYEWEFSEMNPPVQGWAVLRLFEMEYERTGVKDFSFLKKCFHKLIINFAWWVNKVDAKGNNVFEGGFLGLDNITVIDRSSAIPGGGVLEQSDGTGWMGMFCLSLMRMALELATQDADYEAMAIKFFEHYVYIAAALHKSDARDVQIWNEKEGFFYDVLNFPNGSNEQILVRSLVGIIPLYAIDSLSEDEIGQFKEFKQSFHWFLTHRKDLVSRCVSEIDDNGKKRYLLALCTKDQIAKVLHKVWDPSEFKSEFGVRSLSKKYAKNPYVLLGKSICYEPAEAVATLKGGNSNWRGPIWFPTSFLLIDSLKKLDKYTNSKFSIQLSEKENISAKEMANHIASGLIKIFQKDESGKRPVFGDYEILQTNKHWQDNLLFFEHFHGDTGRGLGAMHQTGWTGLVANLIDEWSKK